LYTLYPRLRKRRYFDADIGQYDQSLLYGGLMWVALMYCCFYDFQYSSLARVLMADITYRLSTKYLHMVGMDELFLVLGMMFSGKFETSTGNTLYQVFVYLMYIFHKMEKYKDHADIVLLHLA
jgi:hypothetical protein